MRRWQLSNGIPPIVVHFTHLLNISTNMHCATKISFRDILSDPTDALEARQYIWAQQGLCLQPLGFHNELPQGLDLNSSLL